MSEILIDTHILIWMLTNPSKLSSVASAAIKQAEITNSKIVQVATIVEKKESSP